MSLMVPVLAWWSLALPMAVPEVPTPQPPARFALVVGHNQGDEPGTATLRYADDDALATRQLLTDAGVDTVLLTRLDGDSARLHPDARPAAGPTLKALVDGMEALRTRMLAARDAGRTVEFLFFYSGHGSVQHGQGHVVLEDARFTRADLLTRVLGRSPAHANHVIVDACKSYYFIFGKGPGGRRSPAASGFSGAGVPPNTGFILSTSSDRDSHEWEEFGAGVFSHELLSALRGGADADVDGRITYAEVGAFLESANAGIRNARYRPDFLVMPPEATGAPLPSLATPVLSWEGPGSLQISGTAVGHIYVQDALGVRLADVHAAADQPLTLHLAEARPLFIQQQGGDHREWYLDTPAPTSLTLLAAAPEAPARKGAMHLAFNQLFSEPFDRQRVDTWSQRRVASAAVASAPAEQPFRLSGLSVASMGMLGGAGASLGVATVLALGALVTLGVVIQQQLPGQPQAALRLPGGQPALPWLLVLGLGTLVLANGAAILALEMTFGGLVLFGAGRSSD
jgi:hypothetical protein